MDFGEFPFKNWASSLTEEQLYQVAEQDYFLTLETTEGAPIMVIGAVPLSINVSEVFILPGKGWTHYTIEVCRILKGHLKNLTIFNHRIQALCRGDDEKYAKFLEMFGFELEGTLRRYNAAGDDYHMYAIISEG